MQETTPPVAKPHPIFSFILLRSEQNDKIANFCANESCTKCLHGILSSLYSQTEVCNLLPSSGWHSEICWKSSWVSPYYPYYSQDKVNGMECIYQILKNFLRNVVSPEQDNWVFLPEIAHKNYMGKSTKTSPFFLIYRHHPRMPLYSSTISEVPTANASPEDFIHIWQKAKASLN